VRPHTNCKKHFRESIKVDVEYNLPTWVPKTRVDYSGNIQGTFRKHSGNIQETFMEYSRELSGNTQEMPGGYTHRERWNSVTSTYN
jgi:hypothetical protein